MPFQKLPPRLDNAFERVCFRCRCPADRKSFGVSHFGRDTYYSLAGQDKWHISPTAQRIPASSVDLPCRQSHSNRPWPEVVVPVPRPAIPGQHTDRTRCHSNRSNQSRLTKHRKTNENKLVRSSIPLAGQVGAGPVTYHYV